MSLTRKQFLGTLGKAAVGAAGVAVIAACGGDDDDTGDDMGMADAPPGTPDAPVGTPDAMPGPDAPPPSCVMNGTNVVISGHPHQLTMQITKEDVVAGAEKTYQMGGSGHNHAVTVTAAHFTMLQTGTTVQIPTNAPDGTGHSHQVTVSCA